ncbi:MAG: hypothetical protein WCV93_03425 [Candidatus Shapirobacteria bacterium]|jgi:hypothetical protein
MSKSSEIELYQPTLYVYSKGYFQAQTSFADRVLQLGLSPDIQSSILNYTVIYRHLVGRNPSSKGSDPKWIEFAKGLSEDQDTTDQTWQFYTRQPHSIYNDKSNQFEGEYFGSFVQKLAIDRPTGDQKVEIHFVNQRRGQPKSDFSRQFTSDRIQDLTRLFQSVRNRIQNNNSFNPKWVTLVSWMNSFPGVIASLPSAFVDNATTVRPPELNFRSNSLWGQFLSNDGGVNIERYRQFQESLPKANDLNQLVDCFPLRVLSFRSPMEIFFDHYGIK